MRVCFLHVFRDARRLTHARVHTRTRLQLPGGPTGTRRALTAGDVGIGEKAVAGRRMVPAPVDPLDPIQLERFSLEASGLLKLRPPLPAAPSGDPFIRNIPFQVGRQRNGMASVC